MNGIFGLIRLLCKSLRHVCGGVFEKLFKLLWCGTSFWLD